MDRLDKAYRCKMRLWADSDELTDVVWFRAAKGARVFPGQTAFGAKIWVRGDPGVQPTPPGQLPLGEQPGTYRYNKGAAPAPYLGAAFCGRAEAFVTGGVHGIDPEMPVLANTAVACCVLGIGTSGGDCGCGGANVTVFLGVSVENYPLGAPYGPVALLLASNAAGLMWSQTGLPGGQAMLAGIPADTGQFGIIDDQNRTWHGEKTFTDPCTFESYLTISNAVSSGGFGPFPSGATGLALNNVQFGGFNSGIYTYANIHGYGLVLTTSGSVGVPLGTGSVLSLYQGDTAPGNTILDLSSVAGSASYSVNGNVGRSNSTGGLLFSGGLYLGGNATSGGTITGGSGGTTGLTLTTGSGSASTTLTIAGILGPSAGGTGANLSATGGTLDVVFQSSVGAAFTVGALTAGYIPNLPASIITSGQLALAQGGTAADLSATGGPLDVLQQLTVGGPVTSAPLTAGQIPNLPASKITSGQLALAQGGTAADLSATGGAHMVIGQPVAGGPLVAQDLAAMLDALGGITGSFG